MEYLVLPVGAALTPGFYNVGSSSWAGHTTNKLNELAAQGWRVVAAITHEQNTACILLERGQSEQQSADLSKKLDAILTELSEVKRRKFKLEAPKSDTENAAGV